MCVAYFLSSIINGKTKIGKGAPSVDPLFLRIVDLEACRRFRWDFEVIPCLKYKYREDVRGPDRDWPRNTRVIKSILQSYEDEEIMLAGVMERNEEKDVSDIVPDNWTRCLVEEEKPIFWKKICKMDVDALDNKEWVNHPAMAKENVATENVASLGLVKQLQSLQKSMDAQFFRISDRMDDIDIRLCSVEQYVKEARREVPGDEEGEVLRNEEGRKEEKGDEEEHEDPPEGGEKLESVVTTEKGKKQKQPNQKESDEKEKKQKELKQKELKQKEPELKEAELKEGEQKETEQKEAEQKEVDLILSRSPKKYVRY
ncbi:DNA ligase 1-like [Eutrema salsugineum]|uniref:DNA ligase 1-like n=1 Tax=Eutrema salsugineum TaxID=72664 RepID=UPI000CED10E6|nr:DNA ligase 1-like [Eutrema salsugineum]